LRKSAHRLRDAALLLALLLSAAAPLGAQLASLVKDIDPRQGFGDSNPGWTHAMGGKVFFSASEPSSGTEVWVTDGTALGTELLADVCAGTCFADPYPLGHVGGANGIFFWTAFSEEPGYQLWRSDGTRAGTFPLAPLGNGTSQSVDDMEFALSDQLLFFVDCTERGEGPCALWASDGTAAGTRQVNASTPGQPGLDLTPQTVGGKALLFRRGSTAQVWTSDGTAAGTVLVKDLGAGELADLSFAGSRLFFTFKNDSDGTELWASDGTAAGTLQVTRFTAPAPFFGPPGRSVLKASGRRVYFIADDSLHGQELWRSDGTVAGTVRLTNFAVDAPFKVDFNLDIVEEVGDRAVFIATDGVTVPKLWTSGGSPDSVTALPVPCGGACEFLPQGATLLRAGDKVFFAAGDGVHGRELWTTDGTAAGTLMLHDACPGTCDGIDAFSQFLPAGGTLLFLAVDASHSSQLWSSDGTAAGTRQISNFHAPASSVGHNLDSNGAAVSGSKIFFSAGDSHGFELWVSEGRKPPHLVADIARGYSSSEPANLTQYHGRLFFTATAFPGPFRAGIWQSDGTSDGTFPAAFDPATETSGSSELTAAGDFLFFLAGAESAESEDLWRSDGTAAGTVRLVTGRLISQPAALQGALYFFSAEIDGSHPELWRSDGTAAGTGLVAALPAERPTGDMKALGDELYFVLDSPRQLWKSDGTAAGTVKLIDLAGSDPEEKLKLARLGSRVFFLNDGSLWSTDGTAAGTVQVVSSTVASATELAELGGSLYFLADRFPVNRELWRSNGTAAGTSLLAAFPAPDTPAQLTAAGGRLFFTAFDAEHGFELWQTDGTAAGTRRVQDIAPEAASSTPAQLTVAGDRLFFVADDGLSGRELWTLPLAGAGCTPAPSQLCLSGGRYRVQAVWRDAQGNSGTGTAVALTADTGYFWFFSPSNVEAVVKVLDGEGVNGHVWVFYGALSNVQYDLTVTDSQTGLTRRYSNLQGQFASVGDVYAFGPLGAYGANPIPPVAIAAPSPLPRIAERQDKAAAVPCQPSAERLCLSGNRFAVEVAWKDFQGHTGKGTAVPLSGGGGTTGTFWFFNAANVELVVKALDGRPVNGHFWLFYGALSNVEYTLTVTDTQTNKVRTYTNPSGRFASVGDTSAF